MIPGVIISGISHLRNCHVYKIIGLDSHCQPYSLERRIYYVISHPPYVWKKARSPLSLARTSDPADGDNVTSPTSWSKVPIVGPQCALERHIEAAWHEATWHNMHGSTWDV